MGDLKGYTTFGIGLTINEMANMGNMKNADGENKITFEYLQEIKSIIPQPEGFGEIILMENCMMKKGSPILLLHPDDFKLMKEQFTKSCVAAKP